MHYLKALMMWPPPNGINVARWVKYFEDPALKALHAGQAGSFSYPDEDGLLRDRQMTETRETVEKLKQELQEVRAAAGAQGAGAAGASTTDETSATGILRSSSAQSGWAPGRAARAAAAVAPGQMNLDLGLLRIQENGTPALASAVRTTRAIIAEHV